MKQWLYRLLDFPPVYHVVQFIFAPGSDWFLKKHFGIIFKDSHGLTLDVGCGPKLNSPIQQDQQVVGLDINPLYVKQYVGDRRSGLVGLSQKLPFSDQTFDEARCFGMLHHVPDEDVVATVREMVRCTKLNGRVIVIDVVWPRVSWLRPLAWLNHKLDRGEWIRNEEHFKQLVDEIAPGKWQSYRFTHSFIGHEAVAFTLIK